MRETILNQLENEMPPLVTRSHPKFKEWTGIGGRRMANLDCLGEGPKERVLRGREVAYPRQALLDWIAGRLKIVPLGNFDLEVQGYGMHHRG